MSFFGFFKTRLVGPPIDFTEEENKKKLSGDGQKNLLDLDKVKPTDIPLLAVSGGVKLVGETSKVSSFSMIDVVIDQNDIKDASYHLWLQLFREFIEALDLFVGRYLVLIASGYIILKFVHFKVFPDFP